MEITLELIIAIAFFLVGARFVYIGKMDDEGYSKIIMLRRQA